MISSKTRHPLLEANRSFVKDARLVVETLSETDYTKKIPKCHDSTVGGHIRHCVEHYEALLATLEDGKVDYDARPRDSQIETHTSAASHSLNRILDDLTELSKSSPQEVLSRPLQVALTCGNECGSDRWQQTTLGRELQFQASHMVHHFALIKVMCNDLGHDLGAGFGVATSTLKHRASSASS